MHRRLLLLALITAPAPAAGQQPPMPQAATIPLESYTLPNGLRVILVPDRSSQVVTVDLWYDVGSRNEQPGRTGFAHLFEHMMFQGSANVKKAEHFQLVQRAGGTVNGSTTEDRTNYFQSLPSNRLNLGLWLEADRMRSLAVTDSNFRNQREAVKEERRLRVDNQPYAGAIMEGLYLLQDSTACFPYAHSVIGSMEDLDAAQVEDVQAFFDLYYAPNNATLVVAGDLDPAATRALIDQYFGAIPRRADPPPVRCEYRFGQIRRTWPNPRPPLPAVVHGFRVPEYAHADYPALALLAGILGQGESSRLNRAVVRDQRLATAAFGLLNLAGPRRGPGALVALAIANQGVAIDSLDAGLAREVARLAAGDVSEAELAKARNQYLASRVQQQQISFYLAEAVHTAAMFLGDPAAVNTDAARYMAVTVDDLRRVAARYLTPANSLVLLVTPEARP
jgi:zinc protease